MGGRGGKRRAKEGMDLELTGGLSRRRAVGRCARFLGLFAVSWGDGRSW